MKKWIFVALIFLMVGTSMNAQSLQLTSPNGGEFWKLGSQKNITWTANNVSGTLRIILAKNNSLVGVIAKNLNPNAGSYNWKVGNYEGGKAVPGSGYQVRIQVQGGGIYDDIDGKFSITMAKPPRKPVKVLNLKKPNGGESWKINSQKDITWSALGVSGLVKLVLRKNNQTVGVIKQGLNPQAGKHTWTVGALEGGKAKPGSGYKIRIRTQDGQMGDESNAEFSIKMAQVPSNVPGVLKKVTVTRPNPASNWKIYEKQDIIWEAIPKPEYFYLELYNYNGTKRVEVIFEGDIQPISGNKYRYKWNIPNMMSEPDLAKYKVKILAVTSAGTLEGFSEMFSISKPWEKKHVVLNAAQIINPAMQRADCNEELRPVAQEKPGKARVGHFFHEKYTPGTTNKWCGWIFRTRFHFPLEQLKDKMKLLLEAKLYMRGGRVEIEDPDLPHNKQLKLYALTSNWSDLFNIPEQYFYNNWDYECDVTQQVREWIEGPAVNFGFVAAGPFNTFKDAEIKFITTFRPELEIWYLEDKN